MTKETLEGLRRMEEYSQSCGGVHNTTHCEEVNFSSFFQGYLRPSNIYPKPFILDYSIDHVC